MRPSVREIAVAGVLSGVAVLLAVTQWGFIPFFAGISITIMHVPVIIGAVAAGPVVGTLIGLIFGVSSLILAAVAPKSPADVFFTDPWVSVLPRLFIGIAAWGAYGLAHRLGRRWVLALGGLVLAGVALAAAYKVGTADFGMAMAAGVTLGLICLALVALVLLRASRAHPEELALSLASVVGTLTNTVLVLSALVVRRYIPGALALSVGVANGPAEMIAATVITVAVVAAWRQVALHPRRALV